MPHSFSLFTPKQNHGTKGIATWTPAQQQITNRSPHKAEDSLFWREDYKNKTWHGQKLLKHQQRLDKHHSIKTQQLQNFTHVTVATVLLLDREKKEENNGSYLLAQIRLEHQCHLVSQLNWVHPRIWQPDRQKQFGCLHLYMMLYSIEICIREQKSKLRSAHILCSISQILTNDPKLTASEYNFFLIW